MWIVDTIFSKTISILFPPSCYICRKEGVSLCSVCLQSCEQSIDTPTIYITSIYCFRNPHIKKIIHAIKYFHRKDLIEPLSEKLIEEIQKELLDNTINNTYTLIPIPMATSRKYTRGYNQAECLASEIANKCQLKSNTTLLIRKKQPQQQVKTKTRHERLVNQRDSFIVTGDVTNMHIILVDDVTTTGATIIEARKVLLLAGATIVRAVTIAH
jgi:ComF family protein